MAQDQRCSDDNGYEGDRLEIFNKKYILMLIATAGDLVGI
jgi:hypothetical protein